MLQYVLLTNCTVVIIHPEPSRGASFGRETFQTRVLNNTVIARAEALSVERVEDGVLISDN
jgi:hypothetical protein